MKRGSLTGVVGVGAEGSAEEVSAKDSRRLGEAIEAMKHPPALEVRAQFQAHLVEIAFQLRSFRSIAKATGKTARIENLRQALANLRLSPPPSEQLSVINALAVSHLADREEYAGASRMSLIGQVIKQLRARREGRGDRQREDLKYAAICLRESFERYTDKKASSVKSGDFVALFGELCSVAIGETRSDQHSVIEQALHGKIVDDSPGVRIVTIYE
jgi:molybdopterin converting factor small subunit